MLSLLLRKHRVGQARAESNVASRGQLGYRSAWTIPSNLVQIKQVFGRSRKLLVKSSACVEVEVFPLKTMEALTAVQIALLTIYDMCKAVDRGMVITGVRLLEKQGGKSGHYVAS